MSKPFWQIKTLEQMSDTEWESLCDGCARCCLLKLQDEDTDETHFTNVSCHLLDIEKCSCKDYTNRKFLVPECLQVRNMSVDEYAWLPSTCAYRLVAEGEALPDWHPLITANKTSVQQAGISVDGFAVSENYIHPDELEMHVIELPESL